MEKRSAPITFTTLYDNKLLVSYNAAKKEWGSSDLFHTPKNVKNFCKWTTNHLEQNYECTNALQTVTSGKPISIIEAPTILMYKDSPGKIFFPLFYDEEKAEEKTSSAALKYVKYEIIPKIFKKEGVHFQILSSGIEHVTNHDIPQIQSYGKEHVEKVIDYNWYMFFVVEFTILPFENTKTFHKRRKMEKDE